MEIPSVVGVQRRIEEGVTNFSIGDTVLKEGGPWAGPWICWARGKDFSGKRNHVISIGRVPAF